MQTCTGLGHYMSFYVECVWHLQGLHAAALTLTCYLLGERSFLAACAGALLLTVNHAESIRAHYSPPLRESFGFPFFALQICLIVWYLKGNAPTRGRCGGCTDASDDDGCSNSSDGEREGGTMLAMQRQWLRAPSTVPTILLTWATVCFCLAWQFSQFVLTTQVTVFGLLYVMGYISPHNVNVLCGALLASFVVHNRHTYTCMCIHLFIYLSGYLSI